MAIFEAGWSVAPASKMVIFDVHFHAHFWLISNSASNSMPDRSEGSEELDADELEDKEAIEMSGLTGDTTNIADILPMVDLDSLSVS